MGIVEEHNFLPLAMEEDPDDYRPRSELAIVIDPGEAEPFVRSLAVFCERIAESDGIPLHVHDIDEVLFVDEGRLEATLGEVTRTVEPGSVVFVPSRVPHAFRNVGSGIARIHAVFPGTKISIRYLERNPAPGTEGRPPGPPFVVDVRELIEGDQEEAIRPVDPDRIRPHA